MAVPIFPAILKNSLKQTQSEKFTKSLQVPGNFPLFMFHLSKPDKWVLPFTPLQMDFEASLTIEAAFCLSLFLLLAAAILQPMVWLDRQRKIQTAAEALCGQLSQYVYAERFLENKESFPDLDGRLGGAAAGFWLLNKIRSGAGAVDSLRIRNAQAPDEKGMICFELDYREKIPFFAMPGKEIHMTAAVRRRAWIGLDGKLGQAAGEQGEEETRDIMVYVGAGMGRYHWYRDCHYISNHFSSVDAGQISTLRNASGSKYKPCVRCGASGNTVETVYITPGGGHYHADTNCKSMVSYVRAVPLKEVEYLGACSYCAGKREKEE